MYRVTIVDEETEQVVRSGSVDFMPGSIAFFREWLNSEEQDELCMELGHNPRWEYHGVLDTGNHTSFPLGGGVYPEYCARYCSGVTQCPFDLSDVDNRRCCEGFND